MAAKKLYTEEEKREALTAYVVLGSFEKAGKLLSIPWQTIAAWKHYDAEWWDITTAEVIAEIEADRRAGKRRALGKAIDVIEDRLEHGNHVIGKDGAMVRVPVPLKDAVIAFGVISDKSKPDGDDQATLTAEERARKFREIAHQDQERRQKEKPN